MRCIQPDIQGDLGTFENGPDRHGELFAAGVALIDARTVGLALHGGHVIRAAMRADRTFGPALLFKIDAGCVGVGEMGGKGFGHVLDSLALM